MQQPSGNHFKALKILHTALLVMFGGFILVSFILVNQGIMGKDNEDMDLIFQVVAAVLSIGSLLVGFSIFKKRLVDARNAEGPAESRLSVYRAACILWWAILEGPGLFATISYLLIGNLAFLALALFHFILLFVFMPRKDNIVVLLKLTNDEVRQLENSAA